MKKKIFGKQTSRKIFIKNLLNWKLKIVKCDFFIMFHKILAEVFIKCNCGSKYEYLTRKNEYSKKPELKLYVAIYV